MNKQGEDESSLEVVLLPDLRGRCSRAGRVGCAGGAGEQGPYLRSRSSVRSVGFCWAFSGVGWEACSCSRRSRWISWRISLNVLASQSVPQIAMVEVIIQPQPKNLQFTLLNAPLSMIFYMHCILYHYCFDALVCQQHFIVAVSPHWGF